MPANPSAYILQVPESRRGVLLEEHYEYVIQPVPVFDHRQNSPMIVLASFEPGVITHLADGEKGRSAGTVVLFVIALSTHELGPPANPGRFILK